MNSSLFAFGAIAIAVLKIIGGVFIRIMTVIEMFDLTVFRFFGAVIVLHGVFGIVLHDKRG